MLNHNQQLPVYHLEPDATGNQNFRVYNFDGDLPGQSDLLIPHRKDHYLVVFIRRADSRQWIDMAPFIIKDNTIYFSGPNQVIVKEGFSQLWSTGIAFTKEFLSFQENASLTNLPLILNPHNGHEMQLTEADISFVEDTKQSRLTITGLFTRRSSRTTWNLLRLSSILIPHASSRESTINSRFRNPRR